MKTLFVTVGGSPVPILEAIAHHRADRVVFVATLRDPVSDKAGSEDQVSGLAAEAQVSDRHDIVRVPADDPARILAALEPALAKAASEGQVIADYTGGTKSMTAALLLAAVRTPGATISLVTGARHDLTRVHDGFQRVRTIAVAPIQRRWVRDRVGEAWARHAYAEAARLAKAGLGDDEDADLERLRLLSTAFARWDAWDHQGALDILQNTTPEKTRPWLPALRRLAQAKEDSPTQAQRIMDFRAAAARRQAGDLHDVAVLLTYRALEGIAAWTLRWHHGVDVGDVTAESPIADLAFPGAGGKRQLGCARAWTAVAQLDGPLAAAAKQSAEGILGMATLRNESILAHGFRPLGRLEADRAARLLDAAIWPAFLAVAGVKPAPALPRALGEV